MTYKSILVGMDLQGANTPKLKVARALAERFGSRVTGLAGGDPQPGPYYASEYLATLIATERARITQAHASLQGEFEEALSGLGGGTVWRAELSGPNDLLTRYAGTADLVIVGARETTTIADPTIEIDPGGLIPELGRPLLIVPGSAAGLRLDRVIVAWKDTLQARRALTNALPLLKASGRVIVVHAEEAGDTRRKVVRAADVVEWMELHDIKAECLNVVPVSDPATEMFGLAREFESDLIVAGAYGHSRLSQWIWGGVTRELLSAPSVCLLLSN